MPYTYEEIKKKLKEKNLFILTPKENYRTTKEKIIITNGIYKAFITPSDYLHKNSKTTPRWFYRRNPFIIYNINQYLSKIKNKKIECISKVDDYKSRDSILKFRCKKCGTVIEKSAFNAMREDKYNEHNGILCPNCDGLTESLHASVLKQVFLHYYSDTIFEEQSCINPYTGKILPTDIVNHRLKIAIEIQGQWHDLDPQKERDAIKKKYWINRGYAFYDYSIRNVSILEYIQLFFPELKSIPDWVDTNYSNKLNIIKIQEMLDSNKKVLDIANELNYNVHRIYDALCSGKLHYPEYYVKTNAKKVVQLDKNKNYIKTYNSYREAERENNMKTGLIASCIYYKTNFSKGCYWIPYDEYIT